jgi:drug/metabolite transporter (DMT)-like permease
MVRRSFPKIAHVLLGSTVIVWAGAFSAIKRLVVGGVPATDIAVARYPVAAPGFALALVLTGGLPGLTRRDTARVLGAGLLVVVVYHVALNHGERFTTAGTASVIVAGAPGITLALAVALGLEEFSPRMAGGLGLAFAGVLVVVVLGSGERISLHSVHGPLLVLAAPLAFAGFTVIVKPLLDRYSPIAVTSAVSLVGTLALLPLAGPSTLRTARDLSGVQWLLVAYLGIVATLLAYVAWTLALRRLDASHATSFLYGVPVVGVAIGAIALGESVTVWLAVGRAMIVGGVALAQ